MAALTACSNPIERITTGCETADQEVVDTILETASPDPKLNGMRRIEFVRAKAIDLPDDMQKFDFDQLMVITTAQFFDESRSETRFPGVEVPTTFALDSETGRAAPIDDFALTTFTYTDPIQENPDWDDWVESITYSDPFSTVSDCAASS